MNGKCLIHQVLSLVLAAVILSLAILPAGAEELTAELTLPTETTAATEEIPALMETTGPEELVQTTAATEPQEVPEPPAEETEPLAEEREAGEAPVILTIADARNLEPGTENITIQGIVVFSAGPQAVLQDDTGGIRLSFAEAPEIALGDVLLVTGKRSGGFTVDTFEKTGTAQMPAVETTLMEAEENLRLHIAGRLASGTHLQQGDFSLSLIANFPQTLAAEAAVDAWGVIMDSCFYADTILPREEENANPPSEWNFYFGQLHAHTNLSDGTGTVTEAFSHAAAVEHLDFFAVTDHSNSFDNHLFGEIGADGSAISTEWAAGKAAAAAVTDETFVGIFGYEMTWPNGVGLGHINTFHTPGWQSREQTGFETLQGYYDALTTVPGGISQFNHPSRAYGDFDAFQYYSPEYDAAIQLLEVGGEKGEPAYSYYTKALDAGWHVAPTNNQTNHNGDWGSASSARTVVLAKTLTEESLYEAMAHHRVYASEDWDLEILYKLNGQIMGSILRRAGNYTVTAQLYDPSDAAIGLVEVIADGGKRVASQKVEDASAEITIPVPSGCSYYYLRITQPDGDIAVTAPVWVEDILTSLTVDSSEITEGQQVMLTLELFNRRTTEIVLEELTIHENGQVIHQLTNPGTVAPNSKFTYVLPHIFREPGEKTLMATITEAEEIFEAVLPLHCKSAPLPVSTIEQARSGSLGEIFRVTGYVTAGTANPANTFSNTLYLQNDTGGIAVIGRFPAGIQVGAPVEVTGCLRRQGGNLILECLEHVLLEQDYYRHVPRTMTHDIAMNYEIHGGELLQIEGEVVSLVKTTDGKGISRFTIKDIRGDLATVIVEPNIGSGAAGANELASEVKPGRTVRAMGLLHVDENGNPVLRVRNCEEVVYVPPLPDHSNPKTGDRFFFSRR